MFERKYNFSFVDVSRTQYYFLCICQFQNFWNPWLWNNSNRNFSLSHEIMLRKSMKTIKQQKSSFIRHNIERIFNICTQNCIPMGDFSLWIEKSIEYREIIFIRSFRIPEWHMKMPEKSIYWDYYSRFIKLPNFLCIPWEIKTYFVYQIATIHIP